MAEERESPQLMRTIVQAVVLVAAAVLSDPEMRKNAIYAGQWYWRRIEGWLDPEPPPAREPTMQEVEAVYARAEAITRMGDQPEG